MTNKNIALFLAAFFAVTITTVAVAGEGGRPMGAALLGSSEIPGPGDADGSGTVQLRFNPGQETVCVRFEVNDIGPATAAHIHEGVEGVAGPVVVALPTPDTQGVADGCVTLSRDEIKEIMKNPNEYYVNVHNVAYPAGALRGQL